MLFVQGAPFMKTGIFRLHKQHFDVSSTFPLNTESRGTTAVTELRAVLTVWSQREEKKKILPLKTKMLLFPRAFGPFVWLCSHCFMYLHYFMCDCDSSRNNPAFWHYNHFLFHSITFSTRVSLLELCLCSEVWAVEQDPSFSCCKVSMQNSFQNQSQNKTLSKHF